VVISSQNINQVQQVAGQGAGTGDVAPAQVEAVLMAGFGWLRFPAPLERAFLTERADSRTVRLILAGLFGMLAFSMILAADYLISPGLLPLSAALRVGVFGGTTAIGLVLLHRLGLPALNEWAVVGITVLAGTLVLIMGVLGPPELAFERIVELTLVVAYATVFARFWPMLTLSLCMVGLHSFALWSAPEGFDVLKPGLTLMLVATIVFGLYTTYTREHNDRLAFLHDLRERAMRQAIDDGNRQLQAMARTDVLTGVANRRAFDEALAQHLAHEARTSLSLLMVDVDHFKAFNDHYGHQAGDRCLCVVAEALASCLRRPVDMLARWGGEEFAILLAGTDEAVARQVADRVCLAVQAQALPHAASTCADVVTVSVGMAMAPSGEPCLPLELMHRADAALYAAKHGGRNRVACARDVARLTPEAQPASQVSAA